MLYFRQDDWRTLCAPLIERLTSGTFEKISEVCGLIQFQLPRPIVSLFSQMRKSYFDNANLVSRSFGCCQKILESGLSSTSDGETPRRYSNNSSLTKNSADSMFQTALSSDQSINQILQVAFQILTYEKVKSTFISWSFITP